MRFGAVVLPAPAWMYSKTNRCGPAHLSIHCRTLCSHRMLPALRRKRPKRASRSRLKMSFRFYVATQRMLWFRAKGCHHKDTETQRSGGSTKMNTSISSRQTFVSLCLCGGLPSSFLTQRNNRIHRCRAIRGQKCRESANQNQQKSDRHECRWVVGRNLKQQGFDETRNGESANETQQAAGSYQRQSVIHDHLH